MTQQLKVGRFAPTPSGPLHFGSLTAALGSYLIAKHNRAEWLVRIEDLDPPREVKGAASNILKTLNAFGFEWDREVIYQSQQTARYENSLEQLTALQLTYLCDCSRKMILARNQGIYDGFCRNKQPTKQSAVRIQFNQHFSAFYDQVFGDCVFDSNADSDDFVIKRRDGLFAYQLAVVIDDINQGVDHVVRGADILNSTPRQNYLYHCFEQPSPQYYHLPLVVDALGEKLSKSRFSAEIESPKASYYLIKALNHLGQKTVPDMLAAQPKEILSWAIKHWQQNKITTTPRRLVE